MFMKEEVKTVETKSFDLAAILGVTTGYLFTTFDDIYDVFCYLAGETIFDLQMVGLAEPAKQHIFAMYPELKNVQIDANKIKDEGYRDTFVLEQKRKFGDELAITPLSKEQYKLKDPITMLKEIRPDANIAVVEEIDKK